MEVFSALVGAKISAVSPEGPMLHQIVFEKEALPILDILLFEYYISYAIGYV